MRLIRQRLLTNPRLEELLGGRIFYAKSPYDTDAEKTYPQLILTLERLTDAVHGVAGNLTATIICSQETVPSELIERPLRLALEGVFFNDERIFSLKWKKSEPFAEPAAERLPLIVGLEVEFEVREYPSAETSTPDAVQGLNDFFAEKCCVIGRTPFEIFVPTNGLPAVWFETQAAKMTTRTYATTWLEATIRGHLFAPDVTSRRLWLTQFLNELSTVKAIRLRDDSPLRIENVEVDFAALDLDGQLKITAAYGLPRLEVFTTPINHKNFSWRTENVN